MRRNITGAAGIFVNIPCATNVVFHFYDGGLDAELLFELDSSTYTAESVDW